VTGSVAIGGTCLDDYRLDAIEAEFRVHMMKSSLKILLLTVALGTAPQVLAGKLDLGDRPGQIEEISVSDHKRGGILTAAQSNGPTLSEAVEMVKRQYRGRIVSAVTKTSGNREVHHIKVLTEDGKVKTVKIQGRSK